MADRLAYYGVRTALAPFLRVEPAAGGLGLSMEAVGDHFEQIAFAQMSSGFLAVLLVFVLGPRLVVVVGTALFAAAAGALALGPAGVLDAVMIALGAGVGLARPAFYVWAGQATRDRVSGIGAWVQVFLLFHLAANLGGFLGPMLLAGPLHTAFGWTAVLLAGAAVTAVVAVAVLLFPGPSPRLVPPRDLRSELGAPLILVGVALAYPLAYELAGSEDLTLLNLGVVLPMSVVLAVLLPRFGQLRLLQLVAVSLLVTGLTAAAAPETIVGGVVLAVSELTVGAVILGRIATGANPALAALAVVLWRMAERVSGLVEPDHAGTVRILAGVGCLLGGLILLVLAPRLQAGFQSDRDLATPP